MVVLRGSVRLLVAALGLILGLASEPVVTSFAQTDAPPSLTSENLHSTEIVLTGACNTPTDVEGVFALTGEFTFSTEGFASAPYGGTFQEQGSITLGEGGGERPITSLSATFDIQAQGGTYITGTTEWVSGTSTGSAFCRSPYLGGPAELRFQAYNLRYEATIMTSDGQTCTTTGLTNLLVSGAATWYVGGTFDETFTSGTTPSCTGGEEAPSTEQAVADLRSEVAGIPDATSSAELVAILDEATVKLAQPEADDRQADTIDKLNDFIDKVNDYVESGSVSSEQGAALITEAQAIIDQLAAGG